jgi:NADP-dependent 3-hydroxy acid dehydrogenase YdfG
MEKVVLITGASTGIGNETAKLFQTKNWKVAATMRLPENVADLQNIVDVACIKLDVTDQDSVREGIQTALDKFGRIDAVVNNAGFAVVGHLKPRPTNRSSRSFRTMSSA